MVVDSSSNGVLVSLPKDIPPKTKAEISITNQTEDGPFESREYIGKVCWSKPDEFLANTYNIGIEFLDLKLIK